MNTAITPAADSIIATLRDSSWTFDSLLPQLRRGLIARNRVPSVPGHSTFGLCLAAFDDANAAAAERGYGLANERPILIGGGALTRERTALWQHAIDIVAPHAPRARVVDDWKPVTRVQRAIEWLTQHDRASAAALRAHSEYVCCIDGVDFISSSHPRCLGVLFVNPNPDLTTDELALILVHELAHQELFVINTRDRLVRPESDHEHVFAPLQSRPRPAIGRLHACHAIWRMLDAELRMNHIHIDGLRADLTATLATFERTSLTDLGRRLVDDVYFPVAEANRC